MADRFVNYEVEFFRRMIDSVENRVQRVLADEIAVVPYDSGWPEMFRAEAEHLRRILPPEVIGRIEHFGSTAVPGLPAKPIVDMLIEVSDLDAARLRIAPLLEGEGYDYFWRPTSGDNVPPFYAWFIKRNAMGDRTHHLHFITTAPEFDEHWSRLRFRNYLLAHPDVAHAYGDLKLRLAREHAHDRVAYTRAKSDFIARVTADANCRGAEGLSD